MLTTHHSPATHATHATHTSKMGKVEVQIRSCFCCGLSLGTVFIAFYTLLLYSLLTGLAIWGLSDTANNGDVSHYNSCELEAQGKIRADNRKLAFHEGHTTVIVEDSTSYWCSIGLYTAELKWAQTVRYTLLVLNILLYVAIVIASILLLIALALYNEWLLLPWIFLMAIDIIRGLISVLFIFIFSHGNLARIATGIFFLGLQFFHISILMIIIAKFQRIYNRKRGIPMMMDSRPYAVERQFDQRAVYPANMTPSNYSPYSPNNIRRSERDVGPPPPQEYPGTPRDPRDYPPGTPRSYPQQSWGGNQRDAQMYDSMYRQPQPQPRY
ncbi:hypothetical protein L596_023517 [Steinernema carpocapsae]|uniref:Uncharacterized protein n=1 Tax=Steinernema carpocapsae TaxID=34508 RepID=A0A4U5MDX7_STECR|nr:hypothetical protein L596_023517 [Steinernema carpocapsae]